MGEVVGRHPLQHRRRRETRLDQGGVERHEFVYRADDVLGVGQATFDGGLDSLRRRGYMVLFGAASGPVPPLDPQILNQKGGLFLTRPALAHYTATREELLWRAESILSWIGNNALEVRIGGTYALADAAQAHRDLEGRKTTGKLLLIP